MRTYNDAFQKALTFLWLFVFDIKKIIFFYYFFHDGAYE